jgi:integrase
LYCAASFSPISLLINNTTNPDLLLISNKTGDKGSESLCGAPISESTISKTFNRLRRLAGVVRCDGAPPRMQDLRHTFAVHRITAWIRKGVSLDRTLPALAVYMGQVGLESTERYLSMTPERFRRQLYELSSIRMKKHWRDDKELMAFLNAL